MDNWPVDIWLVTFLRGRTIGGDFSDVVLILCQIVLNIMFIKEKKMSKKM